MVDQESSTEPLDGSNPIPHPTVTVSVAVARAYTDAFNRGVGLELADLYSERDRAASDLERCLEETDRSARAAALRGYEHAVIARNQGEVAIPPTFTV